MIGLVSQIDSKKATCCHIMQPTGIWLVLSVLAAGTNRKTALVRIFCKLGCVILTVDLFHQLSLYTNSLHHQSSLQKLSFIWKAFIFLTFKRLV